LGPLRKKERGESTSKGLKGGGEGTFKHFLGKELEREMLGSPWGRKCVKGEEERDLRREKRAPEKESFGIGFLRRKLKGSSF